MNLRPTYMSAMAACALLAACGSRGTVPRPPAYPRLDIPVAEYAPIPGLPLAMEYNTAASTVETSDTAGAIWVTVEYPRLGAHIYVTFVPTAPGMAADAADSRHRHMTDNLGLSPMEVVTPAGEATFYATDRRTPTPMGAVMYAPGHLVSATLMLDSGDYSAAPDSMMPAREYVMEDMWHVISTMKPWK